MHSKGNYKQIEKLMYGKGENIYKVATDKCVVTKIYEQLIQLNIKKTNNPIKKELGIDIVTPLYIK